MNQYVSLQSATPTTDSMGGTVQTWAEYGTAYCAARSMTASERVQAQQMQAVRMTCLRTYWRADVSVKDRVILGGETLEVQAVAPTWDSGVRYIDLDCVQVDA